MTQGPVELWWKGRKSGRDSYHGGSAGTLEEERKWILTERYATGARMNEIPTYLHGRRGRRRAITTLCYGDR